MPILPLVMNTQYVNALVPDAICYDIRGVEDAQNTYTVSVQSATMRKIHKEFCSKSDCSQRAKGKIR